MGTHYIFRTTEYDTYEKHGVISAHLKGMHKLDKWFRQCLVSNAIHIKTVDCFPP